MNEIQFNSSKSSFDVEIKDDEVTVISNPVDDSLIYSQDLYIKFSFKKTIPEKEAWHLTYLLSEYLESVSLHNTGYEGLIK
jgi:hypothetical protein